MIEIHINLKNKSSKNIESIDLNKVNILSHDQKRTRKLISIYTQIVLKNEDIKKFSSLHATFMTEILSKLSFIQNVN